MKIEFDIPEQYVEEARRRECNVILIGVVLASGDTELFVTMGTPVLAADVRSKLRARSTEDPWPHDSP